jgi:hypothetical protein
MILPLSDSDVFDRMMIELELMSDLDGPTGLLHEKFKENHDVIKQHFVSVLGDGYQFHRGFRQYDVLPSGSDDMLVWNLIHDSEFFWDCYNTAKGKV